MSKYREHKFRGQDDSGKWHYGSLITMYDNDGELCYIIFKGDKSELQNIEPWDDFILVKPESVGEYSGLKDHSSEPKEIYEGDIIEGEFSIWMEEYEHVETLTGAVFFTEGTFVIESSIYANMPIIELNNIQIIGNITDNPELLDKKE